MSEKRKTELYDAVAGTVTDIIMNECFEDQITDTIRDKVADYMYDIDWSREIPDSAIEEAVDSYFRYDHTIVAKIDEAVEEKVQEILSDTINVEIVKFFSTSEGQDAILSAIKKGLNSAPNCTDAVVH